MTYNRQRYDDSLHYAPEDFFEVTTRQGKENVWYNFKCLVPGCWKPMGFDVTTEQAARTAFALQHVPQAHGTIRGILARMTTIERSRLANRIIVADRIRKEATDMGRIEDLERQRRNLAAQAERTLLQLDRADQALEEERTKQADKLEKYGEDAFAEGTVITFQYQFPNTFQKGPDGERIYWPMKYLYAAIKADGLWYTTGPKSPKAFTWQSLVDWWENGRVTKLRVVTKTEKIL
jgi:hypothetical protein